MVLKLEASSPQYHFCISEDKNRYIWTHSLDIIYDLGTVRQRSRKTNVIFFVYIGFIQIYYRWNRILKYSREAGENWCALECKCSSLSKARISWQWTAQSRRRRWRNSSGRRRRDQRHRYQRYLCTHLHNRLKYTARPSARSWSLQHISIRHVRIDISSKNR